MAEPIHSLVVPVVALAVHRMADDATDPAVLFVRYRGQDKLTLPFDIARQSEQPYVCGMRLLNSLFDLGLRNSPLRNYYTARTEWDGQSEAVVSYYTLKIQGNEQKVLMFKLEDELDSLKIDKFRWIHTDEAGLMERPDEIGFDPRIVSVWEILRHSIRSNYRGR